MIKIVSVKDNYFICKLNILIIGFFISIYSILLLIKYHSDNYDKIKIYSSFGLLLGLIFTLCGLLTYKKEFSYQEI